MANPPLKTKANYHRLASVMTGGKDLAILRRFDELSILSLLSLQAEILHLESQYNRQCERDGVSNDASEAEYSTYFRALHKSREANGEQIRLLDEIQLKITAYNNLLLQALQLSKADHPGKLELATLRGWLRDAKGGNNFLDGVEAETWTEENETKYFTIKPAISENDVFTAFLRDVLVGIFHKLCGERMKAGRVIDEESGLVTYEDPRIDKASSIITVIIASVLPVLTIFALDSFKSPKGRIGLIVLFTGVFAAVLAIFSSAKRAEIFAATATFAAIEVVYVGTTLGGSSSAS